VKLTLLFYSLRLKYKLRQLQTVNQNSKCRVTTSFHPPLSLRLLIPFLFCNNFYLNQFYSSCFSHAISVSVDGPTHTHTRTLSTGPVTSGLCVCVCLCVCLSVSVPRQWAPVGCWLCVLLSRYKPSSTFLHIMHICTVIIICIINIINIITSRLQSAVRLSSQSITNMLSMLLGIAIPNGLYFITVISSFFLLFDA